MVGNVAIILDYVHTPAPFDIQYILAAMSDDKKGKRKKERGLGRSPRKSLSKILVSMKERAIFKINPSKRCIVFTKQYRKVQ